MVAYELARQRLVPLCGLPAGPTPSSPLQSAVCSSADWSCHWLAHWAHRLGMQPALHRKIWEFAYICQALQCDDMLAVGRRGLGFGCGKEPLASLFVKLGCDVLATDLGAGDARAKGWMSNEQHAQSLDGVWMPELCSHEEARQRLQFRAVDMNQIPNDLATSFDFCWSACALEHLGSIDKGLQFIERSLECLKPGGVAVHTTELNLDDGATLDHHATVLFQKRHFELLTSRLREAGFDVAMPLLRDGDPFLDGYVDVPPYPDPVSVGRSLSVLHLRLAIGGFRTTSVGLVIRKPHTHAFN
jgi:SAM-dependent methyltransferase